MRVAITSQNLDPKIVVSGIATVAGTIIKLSDNEMFFYELGYRDDDRSRRLKWIYGQIAFLFKFPYFLVKNKIEMVHLNVPFDTMGIIREYIALTLSKLVGKKVLLHIHGGKLLMIPATNKFLRVIINRILKGSGKVLVLSDLEVRVLEKNYGFSKAISIANAVDTDYFNKAENHNNAWRKLQVLYLARITESKGIDDIVNAFALLYKEIPFKFVVCGTGPDKESFVKRCEGILGNDFEYRGIVTGDDKLKTIHESNIFILPSRHSEGLPMSLLETMSCGLVPVVTDEASMKDVVHQGINGVRVEKYNGKDIYEKMKELMLNKVAMELYGANARKTVTDYYDTKNYVNKLDSLYVEIVGS